MPLDSDRFREPRRPSRGVAGRSSAAHGLLVLGLLLAAVMSAAPTKADAATVTTFTGPTCLNGTASLLAQWAGSGLPSTWATPTTGTTINLNTAASGYPATSIKATWVSATGVAPRYESFTPPAAAGFPTQYSVPSLELGTQSGGPESSHVIDITFPAPTSVYFPMFDVDTYEYGSIEGFNGATAVAGSVAFRNPPAGSTVTQVGTVSNFAVTPITNYPDNDDRGMLDVRFTTPVTRIRITDHLPLGTNEIGDIWGCQSQDLVKSATTPTIKSATASTITYHTDLTFTVGNTQPTGGMRIYQPQVTDSLATALGGTPMYSAATVTSITATGPAPACTANTSYTGTGVNTMLAAPAGSFLDPGQRCVITVGVDVTYPYTTTAFTKNNTATASGAGTNATIRDNSTNGTLLPTTPKGDTASPTPLVFPPFSPAIDLVKNVDKTTLVVGETLTYTFIATNTGNVPLTGVVITELTFTGEGDMSALTCTPTQPALLLAGGVMTCTATYVVTQVDVDAGQVTNTARVTGTPPTGPNVTDTDPASVTVVHAPAIDLVKTVDKSHLVAGQVLTYTFTATNTGNVTLHDVVITEGSFSGSGTMSGLVCAPITQPAILAPNGVLSCSATYVVTQTDIDAGELTNVANVTGTPPTGPPVTDTDDVALTPILTTIQIEKVGKATDDSWVRMDGSVFELLSDVSGSPGTLLAQYPATPGSIGLFNVSDIAYGTYWLRETKAPFGYSLLAEPVQFTIGAGGITIGTNGAPVVTADDLLITVRDVPTFTYPATGGSGSTPWLLAGGFLLLLAGALKYSASVARRFSS